MHNNEWPWSKQAAFKEKCLVDTVLRWSFRQLCNEHGCELHFDRRNWVSGNNWKDSALDLSLCVKGAAGLCLLWAVLEWYSLSLTCVLSRPKGWQAMSEIRKHLCTLRSWNSAAKLEPLFLAHLVFLYLDASLSFYFFHLVSSFFKISSYLSCLHRCSQGNRRCKMFWQAQRGMSYKCKTQTGWAGVMLIEFIFPK